MKSVHKMASVHDHKRVLRAQRFVPGPVYRHHVGTRFEKGAQPWRVPNHRFGVMKHDAEEVSRTGEAQSSQPFDPLRSIPSAIEDTVEDEHLALRPHQDLVQRMLVVALRLERSPESP